MSTEVAMRVRIVNQLFLEVEDHLSHFSEAAHSLGTTRTMIKMIVGTIR